MGGAKPDRPAYVNIIRHRRWAVRVEDRLLPNGPGGGAKPPVRAEGERDYPP